MLEQHLRCLYFLGKIDQILSLDTRHLKRLNCAGQLRVDICSVAYHLLRKDTKLHGLEVLRLRRCRTWLYWYVMWLYMVYITITHIKSHHISIKWKTIAAKPINANTKTTKFCPPVAQNAADAVKKEWMGTATPIMWPTRSAICIFFHRYVTIVRARRNCVCGANNDLDVDARIASKVCEGIILDHKSIMTR